MHISIEMYIFFIFVTAHWKLRDSLKKSGPLLINRSTPMKILKLRTKIGNERKKYLEQV